MIKSIKLRLYPNKKQQTLINKTFGCTRFVYNHYLDKKIKTYKNENKNISCNQASKDLTLLKKELIWLKDVDKFSLQNSLKDLNQAYENFFKNDFGFPKFRSKNKSKKSYKTNFTNNNIEIFENYIKLPKLGKVKYKDNSFIKGKILNVTISQSKTGKYFAAITYEKKIKEFRKTGSEIGIDLGLIDFCILSNGTKVSNPRYYKKLEQKLVKEQKKLSKKQKLALDSNKKLSDCKNYQKQKIKVAKIHEKIANKRADFLHKLTTNIVKNHDLICIEDLNVKGMVKNKKLAKSISDVSWSEFIRQLSYKCEWYRKILIKVNRYYPSTKTCSCCGHKIENLTLSNRVWICPTCNTFHDRDINAAINILNEGKTQISI